MAQSLEPDPVGELVSLLFGEGIYDRPGAPELSIFADLAPVFSTEYLVRSLENLLSIGAGIQTERRKAQATVLRFYPESGPEELLGRVALQMRGLISSIPENLILKSLAGVRRIEPHRANRASAVIGLAVRLPVGQARNILLEEALDAAREPAWGSSQRYAIAPLADTLARLVEQPGVEPIPQDLVWRLLESVQELREIPRRVAGIAYVAQLAPQPLREDLLYQAYREVLTIPEPHDRAEMMAILSGISGWGYKDNVRREAFSIARSLDPFDDKRLQILARLSLTSDLAFRQEIISEAMAPYDSGAIQWPSGKTALARAYADIVQDLPDRYLERISPLVQTLNLPIDEPVAWNLIPYASPVQIAAMLKELREGSGGVVAQAEGLSRLAPCLPRESFGDALNIVQEMGAPAYTLNTLISLLLHLPEDELPQAIRIAQALGENWYGWRAWDALHPYLPEDARVHIPPGANSVSAAHLRNLWSQISPDVQADLFEQMIRRVWRSYGGAGGPVGESAKPESTHSGPSVEIIDESRPPEPAPSEAIELDVNLVLDKVSGSGSIYGAIIDIVGGGESNIHQKIEVIELEGKITGVSLEELTGESAAKEAQAPSAGAALPEVDQGDTGQVAVTRELPPIQAEETGEIDFSLTASAPPAMPEATVEETGSPPPLPEPLIPIDRKFGSPTITHDAVSLPPQQEPMIPVTGGGPGGSEPLAQSSPEETAPGEEWESFGPPAAATTEAELGDLAGPEGAGAAAAPAEETPGPEWESFGPPPAAPLQPAAVPIPAAPAGVPAPTNYEPLPASGGAFPSIIGMLLGRDKHAVTNDTPPPAQEPIVSTGFAPQDKPDEPVTPQSRIRQGEKYYFLYSIGKRKKWDIAPQDAPIRAPLEKLPPRAHLQVALFVFNGEVALTPGMDVGELELLPNRTVVVTRRAAEPASLIDKSLLADTLFFPVTVLSKSGGFRLRCNLYCLGVLVQSYLVQAVPVGPIEKLRRMILRMPPANQTLSTTLDYTLSNSLNTEMLADLEQHSLSLMLNDNGNGTHGFRFFSADGQELLKEDATFTGQELQNMIEQARGAMRNAAWGSKEEWQPAWNPVEKYRYYTEKSGDWQERLRVDLVGFAKWGWRFYTQTLRKIAEEHAQSQAEVDQKKDNVGRVVSRPGVWQIACKEELRHILPVAMVYDYPIHDALPGNMYTLCPKFLAALNAGTPIQQTICFQGACPSRGNLQVVCPSGFWGYRHILGMPVSIGGMEGEAGVKIRYTGSPSITVAYSTDFALRETHLTKLKGLRASLGWNEADTGEETLDLLRTKHSHLVYFYCHGGLTEDKVPYIQVGPKNDAWGIITESVLPAMGIRWDKPQPLVFINGCHTTALEPEAALDLVTGFVRDAHAAGVIGTEITIFEPLATAFAEECLSHFLNGVPIGDAVRKARLKLLQNGNPLGLVYIPFVVASLAMTPDG